MCCFSGRVDRVERTRIFARFTAPARQALAYQMTVAAAEDVAMILPLPVPAGVADDAVRFLSLEGYPRFFDDLDLAFPRPTMLVSRGAPQPAAFAAPLAVHEVGAFVASFVPTPDDFARLDPRFRLPAATFDAVPAYADWGFAVFQLRDLGAAPAKVHPMAFEFPTRRADALFFPTLHVHDGTVHRRAEFDHVLYAQGATPDAKHDVSARPLGQSVPAARTAGLVDPAAPGTRQILDGERTNRDHWAAAAASAS